MANWLMRCLLLIGLLGAVEVGAAERERIEDFAVELVVEADGNLLVTEQIRVWATGEAIKRGIYRDFPVRSINRWMLNQKVGFELLEVQRDGRREPYFSEAVDAVQRIYIGNPDYLLEPGRYQYRLRYRSSRQLLQRDGEDELYWNVTGNDWHFPIERASIRVTLPEGAEAHAVEAYTGYRGEQGKDYRLLGQQGNQLSLATTRELLPGEGFTVAIAWPAGLLPQPDGLDRLGWLLADNPGSAVGIVALLGLLLFYLWHWLRVGRDPRKGLIIPQFEGPKGLSAAALGYVSNKGWSASFGAVQALTVALTSMAIKRAIVLNDGEGAKAFLLEPGPGGEPLSSGEKAVLEALFEGGKVSQLQIGERFQPRLGEAVKALSDTLETEQRAACFRFNRGIWWWGVAATFVAILATQLLGLDSSADFELVAVALLFMFAFGAPGLFAAVMGLRRIFARSFGADTWLFAVFGLVFGGVGLGALAIMGTVVAPLNFWLVLALLLVCLLFRGWLEAPTVHGRNLLDHIEGYREYLTLAESDSLALAGAAPAMSIALYEHHLPYAMALGVEQQWSERFSKALHSGLIDASASSDYRPDWYRSKQAFSDPQAFSSRLSAGLGAAAASSSTAPASSSSSSGGSSGGGSSGGGGGGGGGGGW
nr:DUF2207 domain-containing protein [uncultured Pseudomonas sp.]